MPTRGIIATLILLAAHCGGGSTCGETPRAPLAAILEADRNLLHILPKQDVLLTCKSALAKPLEPEREAKIRMRRGWVLYELGEYADARSDFDWVLGQFPDHLLARRDRAICLLHEGQATAAVRKWEALIARDPTFAKSYESLAQVYLLAKRSDRAISLATTGLQIEPNNAMLLYTRASAYFNLQDFDACLRDVDLALSKDCLDFNTPVPQLHAVRGRALLAKKQHVAAARDLYIAIRLDPKPAYKTALCQVLLNLRKTDLALALARELDQYPDARKDLDTMRVCAVAFSKGKEYEKASEYRDLWIATAPSDTLGHEVAGLIAFARYDYVSAQQRMEQALKLNPRAEGALGAMALMFAFDPDTERRDAARALMYSQQLCEATQEHPARGFAILGFVHLGQGSTKLSADAFRKALEVPNALTPERTAAAVRNLQRLEQMQGIAEFNELAADARLFAL